jgi:hypothetical protein
MQFGHLNRRVIITLLGSAAAALPFKALAQSEQVRRIGVLMGFRDDAQGQVRSSNQV